MRGVDMMDSLIESYHPGKAMKKLCVCLFVYFVNILNASVIATCSSFHFQCCNLDSKMMHLKICSFITLLLVKSEDETRINQEKTMARELPGVIKTDKSHNESAPVRLGRCIFCKRNKRLKCKRCGVEVQHDCNSLF